AERTKPRKLRKSRLATGVVIITCSLHHGLQNLCTCKRHVLFRLPQDASFVGPDINGQKSLAYLPEIPLRLSPRGRPMSVTRPPAHTGSNTTGRTSAGCAPMPRRSTSLTGDAVAGRFQDRGNELSVDQPAPPVASQETDVLQQPRRRPVPFLERPAPQRRHLPGPLHDRPHL